MFERSLCSLYSFNSKTFQLTDVDFEGAFMQTSLSSIEEVTAGLSLFGIISSEGPRLDGYGRTQEDFCGEDS